MMTSRTKNHHIKQPSSHHHHHQLHVEAFKCEYLSRISYIVLPTTAGTDSPPVNTNNILFVDPIRDLAPYFEFLEQRGYHSSKQRQQNSNNNNNTNNSRHHRTSDDGEVIVVGVEGSEQDDENDADQRGEQHSDTSKCCPTTVATEEEEEEQGMVYILLTDPCHPDYVSGHWELLRHFPRAKVVFWDSSSASSSLPATVQPSLPASCPSYGTPSTAVTGSSSSSSGGRVVIMVRKSPSSEEGDITKAGKGRMNFEEETRTREEASTTADDDDEVINDDDDLDVFDLVAEEDIVDKEIGKSQAVRVEIVATGVMELSLPIGGRCCDMGEEEEECDDYVKNNSSSQPRRRIRSSLQLVLRCIHTPGLSMDACIYGITTDVTPHSSSSWHLFSGATLGVGFVGRVDTVERRVIIRSSHPSTCGSHEEESRNGEEEEDDMEAVMALLQDRAGLLFDSLQRVKQMFLTTTTGTTQKNNNHGTDGEEGAEGPSGGNGGGGCISDGMEVPKEVLVHTGTVKGNLLVSVGRAPPFSGGGSTSSPIALDLLLSSSDDSGGMVIISACSDKEGFVSRVLAADGWKAHDEEDAGDELMSAKERKDSDCIRAWRRHCLPLDLFQCLREVNDPRQRIILPSVPTIRDDEEVTTTTTTHQEEWKEEGQNDASVAAALSSLDESRERMMRVRRSRMRLIRGTSIQRMVAQCSSQQQQQCSSSSSLGVGGGVGEEEEEFLTVDIRTAAEFVSTPSSPSSSSSSSSHPIFLGLEVPGYVSFLGPLFPDLTDKIRLVIAGIPPYRSGAPSSRSSAANDKEKNSNSMVEEVEEEERRRHRILIERAIRRFALTGHSRFAGYVVVRNDATEHQHQHTSVSTGPGSTQNNVMKGSSAATTTTTTSEQKASRHLASADEYVPRIENLSLSSMARLIMALSSSSSSSHPSTTTAAADGKPLLWDGGTGATQGEGWYPSSPPPPLHLTIVDVRTPNEWDWVRFSSARLPSSITTTTTSSISDGADAKTFAEAAVLVFQPLSRHAIQRGVRERRRRQQQLSQLPSAAVNGEGSCMIQGGGEERCCGDTEEQTPSPRMHQELLCAVCHGGYRSVTYLSYCLYLLARRENKERRRGGRGGKGEALRIENSAGPRHDNVTTEKEEEEDEDDSSMHPTAINTIFPFVGGPHHPISSHSHRQDHKQFPSFTTAHTTTTTTTTTPTRSAATAVQLFNVHQGMMAAKDDPQLQPYFA